MAAPAGMWGTKQRNARVLLARSIQFYKGLISALYSHDTNAIAHRVVVRQAPSQLLARSLLLRGVVAPQSSHTGLPDEFLSAFWRLLVSCKRGLVPFLF